MEVPLARAKASSKAPARGSAGKKASSRPARARSGASRGGKGKGKSRSRPLLRWALALLLGLLLGIGLVGLGLYRAALEDVDSVLKGPVWSRSGRVVSAPQEIYPGLSLSPAQLGQDLSLAGYVVLDPGEKPARPGDVALTEDKLLALVPAASGPGWSVPEAEVLITFRGGRVASVSPSGRAIFAPAELATVRGADNEARRPVALSDLPDPVIKSVLAMEDARFYSHEGIDPLGIARALIVNAVAGDTRQGGSTLTQQLAKNLFLSQERTWQRKAREAFLALALERRLSKDQVLELYLNGVYLGQADGGAVCGVDQAAHAWFGKPATRLELGEAATLAGVISAPNRYSPLRHPDRAKERRDLAISRMAELGWVKPAEAAQAREAPLTLRPPSSSRRAPWAVDAAVDAVESTLGDGAVAARGLTVLTTIQPALQRLAEAAVAESVAELDGKAPGAQMALIAVRVSDGAVVAMVGGRDYAASPYNRALLARRQIGSTVKPLTLLFAFEDQPGLSPATLVTDAPITRTVDGKTWTPRNYDGQFVGELTLRRAIADSRNIPAVLLAEEVGLNSLERRWKSAGLSTATDWPSSALGGFGATPVELAGAYSLFPGRGQRVRPQWVRSATDPEGGLLWHDEAASARLASARAAFLATSVLQEVIQSGTGAAAARYGVSGAVGGKSGTTDDARDAWFAGFNRDLVVVVWVGYDRDRALGLSGSKAALPAWARFVAAAGGAGELFPPPAEVEKATLCAASHLLARPECPEPVEEWFSRGTVPEDACALHGGPLVQVGAAAERAWDRLTERMRSKDKRPVRKLFGRRGE